MIEEPPVASRLLDAWKRRASELQARSAAAGAPVRLAEMTPQQRARHILDNPRPHGGGCPCASCVYNASRLLDELLGPGWYKEYQARARYQRRLEKLR